MKDLNREIGRRAAEELRRRAAAEDTGYEDQVLAAHLPRGSIYRWEQGSAPSAGALAKMHKAGFDVMYILTGTRS